MQGALHHLPLAHLNHHIEGIAGLDYDVLGDFGARRVSDAELPEVSEVVGLELSPSETNDLVQPDLDGGPAVETDELANCGTPERRHDERFCFEKKKKATEFSRGVVLAGGTLSTRSMGFGGKKQSKKKTSTKV